ncbi:MAG: type I DNA topoisomerase [Rhodobiaceae bacterium]|nr:type I DNA topoisomerase [Rhodobiaceae bacterium]
MALASNVVVVESPAKAKTINKYLGPDYKVLASYGHVRDLPSKDGSVDPEHDFDMQWDIDSKSQKRIRDIADAVKDADTLILATDPDREGEAISWHVLEILKKRRALKDKAVRRVVFNAITKQAVTEAMANPRDIDEPLVDAYLARRALDYLVGFTLSPVLWRKLPGARSAGRVQSVALRLVCDREREIELFRPQEYWSILAHLKTPAGDAFEARLTGFDGTKLNRLDVTNEADAMRIKDALEASSLSVTSVEAKPQKRHPRPPFTTSTLQQEASRKYGFSASRTMQVAQRLYEGIALGGETVGLITYMRTDGIDIAPEALSQTRRAIESRFGAEYLPEKPRMYKVKAKNAQEAHEAIRPTDLFRTPQDMAKFLDDEQRKLYDLIWKRTVASQMESAELERTTADILATGGSAPVNLRATGSVIKFDGFLTLYQEGRDDEEDEDSRRLPAMAAGDALTREKIEANQHFTEPPPRYTEATLVKKMEELGIGRPSTYAATLQTLRDRDYIEIDKRRLVPQGKGRLVTAFLESFFARYVEFDFTASLEEQLDRISAGELDWREVLRDFWRDFSSAVDGTSDLRVTQVLEALNEMLSQLAFPEKEDGTDPRVCPKCGEGQLSLKIGKFGAFVGCSNYPECRFTRQLGEQGDGEGGEGENGDRLLGIHPDTGAEIYLKSGRFGPYFEMAADDGEKPKRASLPKGTDPASADLELAIKLLSLPREVGLHPETGKPISANFGRYGPYVVHDGVFANLDSPEDVFTVGLNRAVSLLAEKAGGGRRGGPKPLVELGEHPSEGGPVQVMSGRYGPYVKHGRVNATLPKDLKPEDVTMDKAVELIAAKAGSKGGGKAKGGAKGGGRKKAAAASE